MTTFFSVNRDDLLLHLSAMQPICTKRSALDITETILFHVNPRELILKATDLEISLQSSMSIESNLTDPQTFLISGKRIFEIVRELSDTLTFTFSGSSLQLKAGEGISFTLAIKPEQDFPAFPERIENIMHCDGGFLLKMFNKVGSVVPQNNAHRALNGLFFEATPEGISFVGTDGHTLARAATSQYNLPESTQWLIPRRALFEVKKLLEQSSGPIFIGTCSGQLVFSGAHFNFFTRLLADPFPNYRPALVTEGFNKLRIERTGLTKSLKRAGALLAGQFISTHFTFATEHVVMHLENKDIGSLTEQLSLKALNELDFEAYFYSPYILTGLSVVGDEQVTCFVKDKKSPLLIVSQEQDHDFTYVVMPVSRDSLKS